jgi:hypothetical protein
MGRTHVPRRGPDRPVGRSCMANRSGNAMLATVQQVSFGLGPAVRS